MIDKQLLFRRMSFAAYFFAAFLVFVLLLFPFDRLKGKLESEVGRQTPFLLSIDHISPRFFNYFVLTDVVVSNKSGTVLFESPSVRTSFSLFSLLRGLLSLDLRSKAYGGDLLVKVQQGPGRKYLLVDAQDLDVSRYPLFKAAGLKMSGKFGGNFEMIGDAGKGRFWIKGLTSRELKIKGFPIPDLDFEQSWIEADVKGDRLTIKKFELDGKELKIRGMGDVVLRERGMLNLLLKLKPSERLAHEQAMVVSLLKNKDADGFYQFSLGGTLSDPVSRF